MHGMTGTEIIMEDKCNIKLISKELTKPKTNNCCIKAGIATIVIKCIKCASCVQ